MSDLVERLRTRNGRPDGFGIGPVCDDAADRIAELEAALRQIGDMAHDASTGPAVPDTLWDIRCEAYELLKD